MWVKGISIGCTLNANVQDEGDHTPIILITSSLHKRTCSMV